MTNDIEMFQQAVENLLEMFSYNKYVSTKHALDQLIATNRRYVAQQPHVEEDMTYLQGKIAGAVECMSQLLEYKVQTEKFNKEMSIATISVLNYIYMQDYRKAMREDIVRNRTLCEEVLDAALKPAIDHGLVYSVTNEEGTCYFLTKIGRWYVQGAFGQMNPEEG